MRLTARDAVTTLLIGLIVAMGFAITQEWGWPLLGSERTGVVMLALVGLVACAVGGMTEQGQPPTFDRREVSAVLHVAIAIVLVVGLISPSRGAVMTMVGILATQWLVATARHAMAGRRTSRVA